DALASALVQVRGFSAEDFASFHPGGQLGRNLFMNVGDVMQSIDKVACAHSDETLREVVIRMTKAPLGAACVLSKKSELEGILTDGDIRRLLSQDGDILAKRVGDCMTTSAVHADTGMSLVDAIRLMEERPSQISVLPVVEEGSLKCLGLVRLHDVYQPSFS
ncbi:MAG: CBS domain-containing protein, partial [Verrucomicrobiota bacterium]|nr:CBS domain-containing protein [Verrucomicrobiota bacterium]